MSCPGNRRWTATRSSTVTSRIYWSRLTSPGLHAKRGSAASMKWQPISRTSAAEAGAGGSSKPAAYCQSTSVGFFLLLRGALLLQRFRRLLLVLFLSIHSLAHDSLLWVNQRLIFRAAPGRYFRLHPPHFRPFSARGCLSGRCAGMTADRSARRLGRLLAHPADAQLSTCHTHLLQFFEYLLRHAFGQVHIAVIFANIHASDVHTLQP